MMMMKIIIINAEMQNELNQFFIKPTKKAVKIFMENKIYF